MEGLGLDANTLIRLISVLASEANFWCWWSSNTEKNKEKEKGKGKEERREKRKKERGEFNLEDPMFLLISILSSKKL